MADANDTRSIDVSTPSHPKTFCVVDASDYQFLDQWRWRVNDQGYVVRSLTIDGRSYKRSMHRIVADAPEGIIIDHINGNRLDNRRQNLRYANHRLNAVNRRTNTGSRLKGAYRSSTGYTWESRIRVHGKTRYLGTFLTQKDAALAYDAAAVECFGPDAVLNFPELLST